MRTQSFIKRFLASMAIFLLAMLSLKVFLDERTENLTQQKYLSVSKEVIATLNTLIASKQEQTTLAALSLAQNNQLKQALKTLDFSPLAYERYLDAVKRETPLQNAWLHILNPEGISLYRSWSSKRGDSVYDQRADVREIIKTQRPIESHQCRNF